MKKVLLGSLGLVLAIVAIGAFMEITSKEVPPTAEEANLVVNIQQLAEQLQGFEPDLSKVAFTKTQYLDDSYELEYEYDDPAEAKGSSLYLPMFP